MKENWELVAEVINPRFLIAIACQCSPTRMTKITHNLYIVSQSIIKQDNAMDLIQLRSNKGNESHWKATCNACFIIKKMDGLGIN